MWHRVANIWHAATWSRASTFTTPSCHAHLFTILGDLTSRLEHICIPLQLHHDGCLSHLVLTVRTKPEHHFDFRSMSYFLWGDVRWGAGVVMGWESCDIMCDYQWLVN